MSEDPTKGRIRLVSDRCRLASEEQLARLEEVVEQLREWREILHIHPDAEIEVCYDMGPSGEYLMSLATERGAYGRYRLWCSAKCLDPERDHLRLMDCIHELLHILLGNYTRTAEGLAGDAAEVLEPLEESVVTTLEKAFAELVGIDEFGEEEDEDGDV